jgi:hypothetical protein
MAIDIDPSLMPGSLKQGTVSRAAPSLAIGHTVLISAQLLWPL